MSHQNKWNRDCIVRSDTVHVKRKECSRCGCRISWKAGEATRNQLRSSPNVVLAWHCNVHDRATLHSSLVACILERLSGRSRTPCVLGHLHIHPKNIPLVPLEHILSTSFVPADHRLHVLSQQIHIADHSASTCEASR